MGKHAIHIGTSGWSYKHWGGTFYPEELKVKDRFKYYTEHFKTVELNNTFYQVPRMDTFLKWRNTSPDDFMFVVKANRFITHYEKLKNASESIQLFLDHTLLLEEKLGAILFQLPPSLKSNLELLDSFLQLLPRGLRYVFEFRNKDWFREEIYELLKKYNCALCIYELAGYQSPIEFTADYTYVRLHGPGRRYKGNYSDETLQKWAEFCKNQTKKRDVFVYFDNDEKGYAAFNAMRLAELLIRME